MKEKKKWPPLWSCLIIQSSWLLKDKAFFFSLILKKIFIWKQPKLCRKIQINLCDWDRDWKLSILTLLVKIIDLFNTNTHFKKISLFYSIHPFFSLNLKIMNRHYGKLYPWSCWGFPLQKKKWKDLTSLVNQQLWS